MIKKIDRRIFNKTLAVGGLSSLYAINRALASAIPQFAMSPTIQFGTITSNYTETVQSASMNMRQQEGSALEIGTTDNPTPRDILSFNSMGVNEIRSIEAIPGEDLTVGSARIEPADTPVLFTVFYNFDFGERGKVGVSVQKAKRSKSYTLPISNTNEFHTAFAVENPNQVGITLDAILNNDQGSFQEQKSINLPPDGNMAMFMEQLYDVNPANYLGSLEIRSNNLFTAMALRQHLDPNNSTLAALNGITEVIEKDALYFPHIAVGPDNDFELLLTNTGLNLETGIIRFLTSQGGSLVVETDQGTGSDIPYQIQPGGVYRLFGTGQSLTAGSVIVDPDGLKTNAVGTLNYIIEAVDIGRTAVTVLDADPGNRYLVNVKQDSEYKPAIAIQNPTDETVSVVAEQLDNLGNVVRTSEPIIIGPNGQVPKFVAGDLFPNLSKDQELLGSVRLQTENLDDRITAVALQQNEDNNSLTTLEGVPAIRIPPTVRLHALGVSNLQQLTGSITYTLGNQTKTVDGAFAEFQVPAGEYPIDFTSGKVFPTWRGYRSNRLGTNFAKQEFGTPTDQPLITITGEGDYYITGVESGWVGQPNADGLAMLASDFTDVHGQRTRRFEDGNIRVVYRKMGDGEDSLLKSHLATAVTAINQNVRNLNLTLQIEGNLPATNYIEVLGMLTSSPANAVFPQAGTFLTHSRIILPFDGLALASSYGIRFTELAESTYDGENPRLSQQGGGNFWYMPEKFIPNPAPPTDFFKAVANAAYEHLVSLRTK